MSNMFEFHMIYTFVQLMMKGDASFQCRFDLIAMIISMEPESNILASRTMERRRTFHEIQLLSYRLVTQPGLHRHLNKV